MNCKSMFRSNAVRSALALWALTLQAGCERGAPVVEICALPAQTPRVEAPPLATLGGTPISEAEFEAFLAEIRHPGYRPATMREAERLLLGFMGGRLEVQEGRSFQPLVRPPDPGRLEALRAGHSHLAELDDASLGERMARSNERRLRSAYQRELLSASDITVNRDALESIVSPVDPNAPPAPPVGAKL